MHKLSALTVALISAHSVLASAPSFTGLGDFAGGTFQSVASSVSADGSVVVGWGNSATGQEAFRWTRESGLVGIGDLPGGAFASSAHSVSDDGMFITGSSSSPDGWEAFHWSTGGMVGLGDLPGANFYSQALGISGDGNVVVGQSSTLYGATFSDRPFRWTQSEGMVELGTLPGAFSRGGFATAANSDGSVIVGSNANGPVGMAAFRWTPSDGMVALPSGDGVTPTAAYGVSGDGAFIVGAGGSNFGGFSITEAFLWSEATGVIGLGVTGGNGLDSEARGVSDDGSVVIGRADIAQYPGGAAFLWTQATGFRLVEDFLSDDLGLDMTGWHLTDGFAVSADGMTLVGTGFNPSGHQEAWVATIPAPSSLVVLCLPMLTKRRR
ncbi:MAG: hypothetical protein KDA20_00210 [Phycisphaerales bacterium]|nr:hypothetical protein [Phycisphaerales bacterium]